MVKNPSAMQRTQFDSWVRKIHWRRDRLSLASLVVQLVKQPALMWEFNLWVGKIPWRREWIPTPVFWPGESYRLHSPWGCKELNTNEWLSLSHPSAMLLVSFLSHISLFHLRHICFLCSMHIYLAEARFSQLFLFGPFASVLFSVHSYCSLNPSSLSSPSISESPVDCFLTFFFILLYLRI